MLASTAWRRGSGSPMHSCSRRQIASQLATCSVIGAENHTGAFWRTCLLKRLVKKAFLSVSLT